MVDLNNILQTINNHLTGSGCPKPGCLGECSGIEIFGNDVYGSPVYAAYLFIWDDDFNDSTQVAEWFRDAGASSVSVLHVLHDDDNGDRDGRCEEDMSRAWQVYFSFKRKCRVCGCTDDDCSQCIEAQGYPCSWAEEDLCTRCEREMREGKAGNQV
jgi:hypothetical protein